jgi:uncharacterized protein YecE (DUF72 family)
MKRGELRIGISGWTYPPWRGVFYPSGLAQKRELDYASRQVNSIEINGSFYSLQTPDCYRAWYEATPEGFVFSVKGGRFITHMKRLKDVTAATANFFASGVLALREKLGPILWQLPPQFAYDRERLETFFQLLPRDTSQAAALAKMHNDKVRKGVLTRTDITRPMRHALEVRHPSYATEEFIQLLRKHDIALVVADTAGKWPLLEDVTSDFVYVRLHGDEQLYVSGYSKKALDSWAEKVGTWSGGGTPRGRLAAPNKLARKTARAVYVYFDNDAKVHAPFDAMALAYRLGIGEEPAELPILSKAPAPVMNETRADPRWNFTPPRRRTIPPVPHS